MLLQAAFIYFGVAEKQAYYHACYVASAYIWMSILEYFAQPFAPGLAFAEPVVNPFLSYGPFGIAPDKMVDCLNDVLGILFRIVAQKS